MALAERKMRIMSDKKIGVLGGSGEIGKRCVNILTEKGYTVMASYRTRKPMENNENVYVQLDICNENELCMFMANCDVVINCAGASFINGEKIARTAAKMKIPLVDPSGESFLEERIKDIQKDNVFVLSSGCFPGMTGVLLNFLCSQFDDVKSLSGMSISTEIPSQSAIEDFILTNIAGFGQPLKYYNNTLYDAALAAYGYDIKKRMEKLRMKVVIMYGGNELFAAKSVSLVKEKCVSECEVYAYDNMGHSEVLSLHPEKLCEIIRK